MADADDREGLVLPGISGTISVDQLNVAALDAEPDLPQLKSGVFNATQTNLSTNP